MKDRESAGPSADAAADGMLPLWRRIHHELMERAGRWGYPPNVCMTLVHVYRHPEHAEPAALAKATYFPRQTMTFILDTLERQGLASRKPHPGDRRRKVVALTARGRRQAERLFRDLLEFDAQALRSIPKAELAALKGLLARYADALAAQNSGGRRP